MLPARLVVTISYPSPTNKPVIIAAKKNRGAIFFSLFFIPFPRTILALLSRSFPVVATQIRGGIASPPPPSPLYDTCLHFYREKNAAFSSLVGSRRIAYPYSYESVNGVNHLQFTGGGAL